MPCKADLLLSKETENPAVGIGYAAKAHWNWNLHHMQSPAPFSGSTQNEWGHPRPVESARVWAEGYRWSHSAENRDSSICKRQEGTRAWTPSSLPRQFREGCSVPQMARQWSPVRQRGPTDVYAYTRALADKAEGPQRQCLKYICFLLFIKVTHTSGSWRKLWRYEIGTSLVVQWLRLRIQHRGLWFNPSMGTRSHMLQLRPSVAKYINIKKGNAE